MGDRIFGLGCDIVDVSRIQALIEDKSAAFIGRVLTQLEEVEYKKRQVKSTSRGVLYLCTRFAAKEAFSKALGCGVGKDFSFQDLSVLNNEVGQPVLLYSDKLGQWMADNKACAKVSLSDERLYAMATVILFTRDDN